MAYNQCFVSGLLAILVFRCMLAALRMLAEWGMADFSLLPHFLLVDPQKGKDFISIGWIVLGGQAQARLC